VKLAVAALSSISPADFGRNLTRLFNPSWSLVYFPYIIVDEYGDAYRRFVVDGLVGRVIKTSMPEQPRSKTPGIRKDRLGCTQGLAESRRARNHRATTCSKRLWRREWWRVQRRRRGFDRGDR